MILDDLLREARSIPNLDAAFRWARAQSPPFDPLDVIIQDEYTHDVIFGRGTTFVVFDAT